MHTRRRGQRRIRAHDGGDGRAGVAGRAPADTSRMAFETVFARHRDMCVEPGAEAEVVSAEKQDPGGVQVMAFDQRLAASEVRMNASFARASDVTLVSHNGEKWHTASSCRLSRSWLARPHARAPRVRQAVPRGRYGDRRRYKTCMRPELGPRVVEGIETLVDILPVWDGTEYVDASVWSVQVCVLRAFALWHTRHLNAHSQPSRCALWHTSHHSLSLSLFLYLAPLLRAQTYRSPTCQ